MSAKKNISFTLMLVLTLQLCASEVCATGELDLAFRPQVSRKSCMLITTNTNIIPDSGGVQQQSIQHIKATKLEFEVREVDSKGAALIKVTYRSLREETTGTKGRKFEYDSTKPKTAKGNPLAPVYTALIGEGFVIEVSLNGEVVRLIGMDEMLDRMADKMIATQDKMISKKMKSRLPSIEKRKAQVKQTTKLMLNEMTIKELLNNVFVPFPSKPVRIGQPWKSKLILITYPSTTQIDADYVIIEDKGKTAILAMQANNRFDGAGMAAGMQMNASCDGTVEVDKSSGWLISRKVDKRIAGQSKTQSAARPDAGKKMSIKYSITVEPVAVSSQPDPNKPDKKTEPPDQAEKTMQVLDTEKYTQQTKESSDDLLIRHRIGVGKIKFGITVQQMRDILGKPDVSADGISHIYTSLGIKIITRNKKTVNVIICGNPTNQKVPMFKAMEGSCRFKTADGIGIGSTEVQIIKAFGQPTNRSGNKLMYGAKRMSFYLDKGKVIGIRLKK